MIKRVIFSLALLIPAVLHAAINPVPVKSTSASVSSSTWPVTANLGSAPTSGNLLVIAVATNNDAVAMTATVSDGFTAGPLYLAGTAGALGCATFWKKSDGTEQTVDIEVSATTQAGQYVYAEFPGTDLNLNAIEGSGENESNIAGATTSLSSGSASNTTADAVAVAILCTDNGVDQTPSYSNSYTQRASGTTGTNAEIFIANKVVSSTASQTTTGTITSAAGYGAILVFGATGGTCPATCAGGRSARCITDISDASDADNILYGLSPAAVANEDTVCYDPSSVLGDTVNVSAAGWPSIASGGSQLTDSFDYCVMDNGAACGTDGKYEVTFTPVITSVTGIGTGQATGTVTVTPAGPTEGTVRGVAISKTSYDTYGAPTHAQIAAGVDANDANVAWGSEFTKSFLSTVSPGWTFGRASSQTYEKSDGTLGTVTSGNPAFTYSGGTAQGILLEGARTNLLTYSEQFDNGAWSKNGSTVTANSTTAPDGATTADTLTYASAGSRVNRYITVGSGSAVTFSVYLKDSSGNGTRLLVYNGTAGGVVFSTTIASISSGEPVGSGWYRHEIKATSTDGVGFSSGNQLAYYIYSDSSAGAIPASELYLWGAQLEAGAFASSYTPTTTAAVPRVTTDLTRSWTFDTNTFSGYLQAYPGFASTETSATNPVFSAYKDANNYLTITHPTTSGRMDMNLAIGGTTATAQVTGLTWAAGDKLDIRFRKNASGIKLWVEAGSTETTTGVAPNAFTTPPDTVRLGRDESSNYGFWTVGNIQLWNSVDDTALGALN